jgi:hypothetical protein
MTILLIFSFFPFFLYFFLLSFSRLCCSYFRLSFSLTFGFISSQIQFSPFFPDRICAAAAANFGLVGNGRLYILALHADALSKQGGMDIVQKYVPT